MGLTSQLGDLSRDMNLSNLWRWWVDGLVAWLPTTWQARVLSQPTDLIVEVGHPDWCCYLEQGSQRSEAQVLSAVNSSTLLESLAKRSETRVLRLPESVVFSGQIMLPHAAARNLQQVVGFELDRLTPYRANEVYYCAWVISHLPEQKRMRVGFCAVARPVLNECLAQARRLGLKQIARVDTLQTPGINVLPQTQRAKSSWAQHLKPLLNLALLLSVLALIGLPIWQERTKAIALTKSVAVLKQQTANVLNLRDQLDQLESSTRFLLARKHDTPTMVVLLEELSRLLPDDTWLEQLDIQDKRLLIRGQSTIAAKLVGLLESSSWLQAVNFSAPIVTDPNSGREFFQISAQLGAEPK